MVNVPGWAMQQPALSQITPQKPEVPGGMPAALVNGTIMAGGIGIALLGYYHRKDALGVVAIGMGSSVAGAGFIFLMLDLLGFKPQVF